jgi:hypothetical protein
MKNFYLSLTSKINFFGKKQKEADVLEDIEIDDSAVEEFDLQINPFKYLDRNVKYFTYFGEKYTNKFVRRKFDNYSNGSPSYHSLSPIIGIAILFDDDLKIHQIWLHGKDIVSLNIGAGYPGKVPFGLSFGINRDEIQTIMGIPNSSIDQSEDLPNIKNYCTKWDTYYLYEGCIKFGYDYESERCDQIYIIKLPEDIESAKQNLRSYRSISIANIG